MTPEEFEICFDIIADGCIADKCQRYAVKEYCIDHFDEILKMEEIDELSAYIQKVLRKIQSGVSGLGIMIPIVSSVFAVLIRLPAKGFTEENVEKIRNSKDDLFEFLLQFFLDIGVDFAKLYTESPVFDSEATEKIDKIIQFLNRTRPRGGMEDIEGN